MAAYRLDIALQGPTTVAVFGEAVITVIEKDVTAEALRTSVEVTNKVAKLHPAGVVGVTLVYPGFELPGHELR
jgi:hypothetical protein